MYNHTETADMRIHTKRVEPSSFNLIVLTMHKYWRSSNVTINILTYMIRILYDVRILGVIGRKNCTENTKYLIC